MREEEVYPHMVPARDWLNMASEDVANRLTDAPAPRVSAAIVAGSTASVESQRLITQGSPVRHYQYQAGQTPGGSRERVGANQPEVITRILEGALIVC